MRTILPVRVAPLAFLLALPLLLALPGCGSLLTESTSDAAGVAGAGIASSVSSNGSVAAAIGLGVQSATAYGLGYVERDVHRAEQNRIAAAAGPLAPGGVAPWSVAHAIPIEADQHGEVAVSRVISAAPLDCKEIVFSVDTVRNKAPVRNFYVADICRDGAAWHWASAEPAVARWGALQ